MRAAFSLAAIALLAASARGDALPAPIAEGSERSISCGAVNRGALFGGVALPERGAAYVVPEPWASRGKLHGTIELVGLIQRAASAVGAAHPGSVLGVADLSAPLGGHVPGHRSHQSGRDVDLLFYARDAKGAPFAPDSHMPFYTRSGRAYYAYAPAWKVGIAVRFFDAARNWALVKSLVTDRQVEVERIFVASRVEYWLLRHAIQTGEPAALVKRARAILQQPPGRVSLHADHMHVRIACSAADIALGRCQAPARGRARIMRWSRPCPAPR